MTDRMFSQRTLRILARTDGQFLFWFVRTSCTRKRPETAHLNHYEGAPQWFVRGSQGRRGKVSAPSED